MVTGLALLNKSFISGLVSSGRAVKFEFISSCLAGTKR